jgi:hypothetical protein
MALTREQVLILIDRKRDYQDKTYSPLEATSSGLTRQQRDLEVAPGILMLEEYVAKARKDWTAVDGGQLHALQQVAKIAAIAVRILERAGGSEELLKEGLR